MSLRSSPAQFIRLCSAYLNLFHTEFVLFRSEMSSAAVSIAKGLVLLVASLALFLIAVVLLAEAAVAALTFVGWPTHWADLCVAVSIAMIATIAWIIGTNVLRHSSLLPHRTVNQLRKDFEFAKDQMGWHRQ
jgi:uncharacterized membrane protein YqjE